VGAAIAAGEFIALFCGAEAGSGQVPINHAPSPAATVKAILAQGAFRALFIGVFLFIKFLLFMETALPAVLFPQTYRNPLFRVGPGLPCALFQAYIIPPS